MSISLELPMSSLLPVVLVSGLLFTPPGAIPAPVNAPPAPPASDAVQEPTRLLAVLRESALLEPPSPTASPTFGLVVGFAGEQAIVTGPVMSRQGGFEGQVATFAERDGKWTPRLEMPGVFGLRQRDAALQRLAAAPDFFATNLDRKSALRSEVLVFTRDASAAGWKQTATLTTPGGEQAPGFGSAIATDGSFIICSDADTRIRPDKPAELPKSPGVHVFANDGNGTWVRAAVLRRDASRNSTWFGASLATDGARLAIGSPQAVLPTAGDPLRLSDAAVVEIRRRDGANWPLEAEISGRAVTPMIGFGTEVAISGDLLAVRASEIIEAGAGAKVFAFRLRDGAWLPEGELRPRGVVSSVGYGAALAIADGRVLVGDTHAAVPGEPALGVVHVFEHLGDRWSETLRLLPQAPCMPNSFGAGIDTHGRRVLIGRVKAPAQGCPEGGAYLFELPPRGAQP